MPAASSVEDSRWPGDAKLGAHPRHQLLEGERLGHVVVGAAVEPFDALLDRGSGGQRNHREVRESRANRAEDLEAVLAGERQVEQYQRIVAGQRGRLSARAVVADRDGVPVRAEGLLDEPGQRSFVFDHQDSHPDSPYALMQAKSRW